MQISTVHPMARRLGASLLAATVVFTTTAATAAPAPAGDADATAEPEAGIAELQPPDASAPALPRGPRVHLEVKGGRRLSLYGVESEFAGYGSGAGGTVAVHGISYRRLCVSPCDRRVDSGTGTFFLGGGPYTASRRLELPESDEVHITARPGHKALYWLGWLSASAGITMLVTGAVFAGVGLGSKGLHGGLIGGGAGLIVVSVPLFIFGRTRAKVEER